MRAAEAAQPRTAALRLRSACAPVSANPHAESREHRSSSGSYRLLIIRHDLHTPAAVHFGGVPSARTPRTPGMVRDCLTFMGHTGWMIIGWKGGGARRWGWEEGIGKGCRVRGRESSKQLRHLHPSLYHLLHQLPAALGRREVIRKVISANN